MVFTVNTYISNNFESNNKQEIAGAFEVNSSEIMHDTKPVSGDNNSTDDAINISLEVIRAYFNRARAEYVNSSDVKYDKSSIALLGDRDCEGKPYEGKCSLSDANYGGFDDIILSKNDIIIDQDYIDILNSKDHLNKGDRYKVRFDAKIVSSKYGRSTINGFFHIELLQNVDSEFVDKIRSKPDEVQDYFKIVSFNFKNSCNGEASVVCN